MTDITTHYRGLNDKCNSILEESLQVHRVAAIAQSHSFIFDYTNWLKCIEIRPEYSVCKMAIREYQMALLSNNIGLYNQAFLGLRFFFERTLVAILFSAKEINFRLWQRGERDTYWQEIIDENKGVFSNEFCKAFFPELKDEIVHFRLITEKVYRECSEYVHGNVSVQSKVPERLIFDEFLFNEWHAKAQNIKRVVLFCFCLRYAAHMSPESRNNIESVILEEFGYIPAIRDLFSSAAIKK